MKTKRLGLIAKAHIAKKELLSNDDDVYRHWIKEISKGRTDSSGKLTEKELESLIRKFKSFGWKDRQSSKKRALQAEILKTAKNRLGESWLNRLKGLTSKVAGVENVEWVKDIAQLERLLGIIRNME